MDIEMVLILMCTQELFYKQKIFVFFNFFQHYFTVFSIQVSNVFLVIYSNIA